MRPIDMVEYNKFLSVQIRLIRSIRVLFISYPSNAYQTRSRYVWSHPSEI